MDEPAEALGHGCCSVGAELVDEDEAMTIAALAATLDPSRFQYADSSPVLSKTDGTWNTTIVDGACVFLNRAGFAGGQGCALHLGALEDGEEPHDYKPSVCWQLPVRIDWESHPNGTETGTLRRWSRQDWGNEGTTMAWLCTDASDRAADAFVGDEPVIDSLEVELTALLGRSVYVELRARLDS